MEYKTEKDLLPFIKELLNRAYKYDLTESTFEKGSLRPDLIQYELNKKFVDVIVEISNNQDISASEITDKTHQIESYIDFFKPKTFIFFINSNINITAYSILHSFLEKKMENNFKILDRNWITENIDKHIDLVEKYDLLDLFIENISLNNLFIDKLFNEHGFFALGHFWGKEDKLKDFLNNNVWENGHEEKVTNVVNSVEPGDFVFLKSTFSGTLRIKAIGIVFENIKNGHLLKIRWKELTEYIDLPGLGAYRNAISKVGDENVIRILNGLFKQIPKLEEITSSLIRKFEQSDHTEENPKSNKNKNIENKNERVPFKLDQVTDVDMLGREPVAKAFVDIIKKDIFTDSLNGSFMVHLQGEWGAGKSSFLKLIEKNLTKNNSSKNDKWIVIDYNAWLNQNISPPWWTFIDQIYR